MMHGTTNIKLAVSVGTVLLTY